MKITVEQKFHAAIKGHLPRLPATIGRRRVARMAKVPEQLPDVTAVPGWNAANFQTNIVICFN